jgi:enoyl-CoA hydratase/carnithine racemase
MSATPQYLLVSQEGRVLTVHLNNPPVNFLTSAMMTELHALLVELEARQDIGAVILASAVEGVFLTHFDVDEIEKAVASAPFPLGAGLARTLTRAEAAMDMIPGARQLVKQTPLGGVADMNLFHEVTARMRAMDKVFIAAINGRAMGGGCELALACDLRLMVDGDAGTGVMIGQPEVLIGLIPGGGGTQMLARSLGVARALEHCLEGTPIAPAEALALGMINKVVPVATLMDEALALASRMARRSPQAVRALKHTIYQAAAQGWNEGMAIEKSEFLATASQPNTRRAMQYYIAQIRSLLVNGEQMTIDDFQDLINGTAVDMTH